MMKKIVLLFSCLIALASMVYAQTTTPQITRVSVNEKGEVELEWTPNASANDFDHSEVWYRNQYQTDWKKIEGSESASPDSYYFKHNAAQANTRRTYYYVVNYNYVLDPFQSTEVTPIYLIACSRDGKINLTWNHIDNTWTDDMFYIYRQKVGEEWEFVESTRNLNYVDASDAIFDEYSFRVSYRPIDDPTASLSNITDPINHTTKPKTPSISSLVINNEGHLTLEWERSLSNNVTSYEIYLAKNTGGWDIIGHVNSPDMRRWTENAAYDFCNEVRKYGVVAKNVCDVTSTTYPDSSKSNILFSPIIYNPCDSSALLSWLMYTNMQVDAYEIYASYDSLKSFVMIDEVGPEIYSYNYKATASQTCFFQIYAVHHWNESKKQIATSCIREVNFIFSERPEQTYFRHASVKGEDIEVCFGTDIHKPFLRYRLERSTTGAEGSFTTIVDTANVASTPFCYMDLGMNVQNVSYHYQLKTVDTCGAVIPALIPVQSILLQAELNEDRTASLEWTSYDGFHAGLDHYKIYRYVNGELDKSFFPIVINFFTDVDPVVSDITLNIEYQVEAVSKVFENESGDPDQALSNRAKLKLNQSDVITFPNAFAPTGTNNIFKPTIDPSINMSVYRLLIYNRWGELIFETNLQREGWDGRIKGKLAPTGGYAYFLRIVTDTEDSYERRGSFILIN